MTSSLTDLTKRRSRALQQANARPRHLKAVDEQGAGTTAVLYLYGPITAWSWTDDAVTAKNVIRALKDIDADQIDVHLNSPGGDVIEGVAIMNALANHPARIVVHVDALAASAASYVAQAGDEIVMGRGSQLMIHDASMLTWGNAEQLHDDADWLDKQSQNIASIYADRAGGTADHWRELMRAETWYTAAEAVAAGLADRVAGKDEQIDPDADTSVPDGDSGFDVEDSWDLSAFTYAGRQNAPAPPLTASATAVTGPGHRTVVHITRGAAARISEPLAASAAGSTPPAAPASGETITQEGSAVFSDEQMTNLRQSLGLPEDADADQILGALNEALEERADDAPAASTPVVPEGMTLIESDQLEAMRNDAAAGREARQRQLAEDREELVAAAVRDGRISPARRETWVARLEADPGEEEILASLPRLDPTDEIGHSVPNPEDQEDDESSKSYNRLYGDDTEKEA